MQKEQEIFQKIEEISIDLISHDEVRLREINEEITKELAESIKSNGLQQAICVRKVEAGYKVIFGEHRLEACKLAGLHAISCIIKTCDENESFEVKIIENIQRNIKIDPCIEGKIYSDLMKNKYQFVNELAKSIGKSTSYIQGRIEIHHRLSPKLKPLVGSKLTVGNAVALCKLPLEKDQIALANKLMNVREYLRMGGGYGSSQKRYVSLKCRCPDCGYEHDSQKKRIVIEFEDLEL